MCFLMIGIFIEKTWGIALALGLGLVLSGCVSTYHISTGISKDLEDYYTIYPSIEVDVAAITQAEADEIKKGGVEEYFAPNGLRDRIKPFTAFFSDEQTKPITLSADAAIWKEWLEKKPQTMMVMASLPHEPDMANPDPRMLFITMKKGFLRHKTLYFEVEPKKIMQIKKEPQDPRRELVEEVKKPRRIIPLF